MQDHSGVGFLCVTVYIQGMVQQIRQRSFTSFPVIQRRLVRLLGYASLASINYIDIYIIQILSVCVSVCLSSIGGQTAGPIMTKFGTHMRIDLGMVPTNNWPHEWPGSVGSLGPISESGLSCQLLLRAVVWQMTSQ